MCLAVPGQLMTITEAPQTADQSKEEIALRRTGQVSFGGIIKEVSLAYVPEASIGDYLIVHVGFALSILDQDEALQTLNYLAQIAQS
jgi:hydrogenase expression/formation protein HypC